MCFQVDDEISSANKKIAELEAKLKKVRRERNQARAACADMGDKWGNDLSLLEAVVESMPLEYKKHVGRITHVSWTPPHDLLLEGEVGICVIEGDVVTFQGRDLKEIKKAFEQSVDDYLAFVRSKCSKKNIIEILMRKGYTRQSAKDIADFVYNMKTKGHP